MKAWSDNPDSESLYSDSVTHLTQALSENPGSRRCDSGTLYTRALSGNPHFTVIQGHLNMARHLELIWICHKTIAMRSAPTYSGIPYCSPR